MRTDALEGLLFSIPVSKTLYETPYAVNKARVVR